MASVAVVSALDMHRALAARLSTVMTTGAGAEHFRVIHAERRLPDHGAMASFAIVTRAQVQRVLAAGIDPIVATRAIARDAGMVEARGTPSTGAMTGVAGFGGRHMR